MSYLIGGLTQKENTMLKNASQKKICSSEIRNQVLRQAIDAVCIECANGKKRNFKKHQQPFHKQEQVGKEWHYYWPCPANKIWELMEKK